MILTFDLLTACSVHVAVFGCSRFENGMTICLSAVELFMPVFSEASWLDLKLFDLWCRQTLYQICTLYGTHQICWACDDLDLRPFALQCLLLIVLHVLQNYCLPFVNYCVALRPWPCDLRTGPHVCATAGPSLCWCTVKKLFTSWFASFLSAEQLPYQPLAF